MFKLSRYIFIIGMIVFSGWVCFNTDVPTDNQMGVFCLGLVMVFIFIYHVITDIKEWIRDEHW